MMKVKAHLHDYIRESFPSLSDEGQDICDLFIESINARWELSEAQMSLIKSVLTTDASHHEFSPSFDDAIVNFYSALLSGERETVTTGDSCP